MSEGKDVVLWGATAAQEVLSALSIPGSSVLQKTLDSIYEKRKRAAQEVLIEKLRAEGPESFNDLNEGECDELIQMFVR